MGDYVHHGEKVLRKFKIMGVIVGIILNLVINYLFYVYLFLIKSVVVCLGEQVVQIWSVFRSLVE